MSSIRMSNTFGAFFGGRNGSIVGAFPASRTSTGVAGHGICGTIGSAARDNSITGLHIVAEVFSRIRLLQFFCGTTSVTVHVVGQQHRDEQPGSGR